MYWLKSRKEEKTDLPQYQKDFDLSPQGDHSMFWEYLEVGRYHLRCSRVSELSLPCFIECMVESGCFVFVTFLSFSVVIILSALQFCSTDL